MWFFNKRKEKDYRSLEQQKTNRYLQFKWLILYNICAYLIFTIIINSILKFFYTNFIAISEQKLTIFEFNQVKFVSFHWEWLFQPFLFFHSIPFLIYLVLSFILGIKAFKITRQAFYKYRVKPEELVKKGDSRWTTIPELFEIYQAIPEKGLVFPGYGGTPISHYRDKLFIDPTPTNNCIIGTTRSGKGETEVFATIDNISRAEKQDSMVLNDPKGELFTASYKTLRKRNFDVLAFNLTEPDEGVAYNLLETIKQYYIRGDIERAQALTNSLTYSLYRAATAGKGGTDDFFNSCAASLVNALILGLLDICARTNEMQKVTMDNVAYMLNTMGSDVKRSFERVEDQKVLVETNALDEFFQQFPNNHVAKKQYATSNFSTDKTRASIYTTAMEKLNIFSMDNIARMTSSNDIDLDLVGFPQRIEIVGSPSSRCKLLLKRGAKNIYQDQILLNRRGVGLLRFNCDIQEGDRLEIYINQSGKAVGDNVWKKETYSIHYSPVMKDDKPVIDEFTGKVEYHVAMKLKLLESACEGEKIQVKMLNKTKPTAIFMILPDYDASNHVIASIFIRQLYFILADNATRTRGIKCHRRVRFILDEFGNMPAIEGMENIITVCLGRNISFDLYVQDYAQIISKYGDKVGETIKSNCGNHIYILTTNGDTAKEISGNLGTKTVYGKEKSYGQGDLKSNVSERSDDKQLLDATQLLQLKEGESVILRPLKRQDRKRNRLRAYPIFNRGSTAMKFRYEYLNEDFDTNQFFSDLNIRGKHADFDLESNRIAI
ncbi:type IV secretory system conjugative DNA transfer family protein [Listeria innocua]|nr:ATPase [Listeria monocytogenes]EHF3647048.1 type IV secretory system conjugative DNA transfer family protein [Listeria innocua]EAD9923886.1 ATPase [Listeria monocytogenes]EAE7321060.1 ATPase [Listeria monocytogenes]EHF3650186.1 type IV secretory system conjugative DNA transfer family protein [Listeria innocua]